MSKPRIEEVIVVEGRYDRNMLLQVVDATVVETGGFSVFNDREKLAFLRKLAQKRGLILLTDSAGAGFVIRNYLQGAIPTEQVKQAYIPDIPAAPSAAVPITKADLLDRGLIGPGSTQKRQQLLKNLELPEHLTPNALLETLNLLMSREEFYEQQFFGD